MRSVEGDLESIGIPELFRAIANDARTGCLTIHREGSEARVYFRKGMVYQAKILGSGVRLGIRMVSAGHLTPQQLEEALAMQRAEGGKRRLGDLLAAEGLVDREQIQAVMKSQVEDTIFEMMKWESSPFAFDEGVKSDDDLGLMLPVGKLILDSARRFRDWHRVVRRIPSLGAVAQVSGEAKGAEADLTPEERSVLEKIDGSASASEIAYSCGFTDFEVAVAIDGLAEKGLVEIELPPGVELPPEDPEVEKAFEELEDALEEAYRNVGPGTSLEELITPEGDPLPAPPRSVESTEPEEEAEQVIKVPEPEVELATVISEEQGPAAGDDPAGLNVSRLFAEVAVADADQSEPPPKPENDEEDEKDEPAPAMEPAAEASAPVDPSIDTSALLREFSGLGLGEEEGTEARGRSGRKRR